MAKRLGRTVVSRPTARAWKYQAIVNGSSVTDLAGNCERPVTRPMTGVHDGTLARLGADYAQYQLGGKTVRHLAPDSAEWRVAHVDIEVPCRKCGPCLKRRAAHWRLRAQYEIGAARRTWFTTLTLTPDLHWKHEALARHNLERRGWPLAEIEAMQSARPDLWFRARTKPFVEEVQRYFKRLRKAGHKVRYLLIFEAHKTGLPHAHLLIHEQGEPVRHATLTKQWSGGFSTHKLVSENPYAAHYVTKYLTKSVSDRPRSSFRYGLGNS